MDVYNAYVTGLVANTGSDAKKPRASIVDNLIDNYTDAVFIRTHWNFVQFSSKIGALVKNRNFRQQSKFSSKIEISVKNRNFHQKSKFSSKIGIFVKNQNFRQ